MKNLSDIIHKTTLTMSAVALIGSGATLYDLGHTVADAQENGSIAAQPEDSPTAGQKPLDIDSAQASDASGDSGKQMDQSGDDQAITAQSAPQPASQGMFVLEQSDDEVLTSEYIGRAIYNGDGDQVGDVNDLVLAEDGGVNAAIIGVGGFLGLGEKDVAVQFDAIQVQIADNGTMFLVIDASQEELENAPTYLSMSQKLADKQAEELQRQQATQGAQNPIVPVPEPAPANN